MKHQSRTKKTRRKLVKILIIIFVGFFLVIVGIQMNNNPQFSVDIKFKQIIVNNGTIEVLLGLAFIFGGLFQLRVFLKKKVR